MSDSKPRTTVSDSGPVTAAGGAVGRIPAILILVAAVPFVAVNSFIPIGGDLFQAEDVAGRQAVLEADGAGWDTYQAVEGIAIVLMAVALFALGRQLAAAFPRVARPATVAGWLGLLTGASAINSVWNIVASPADVAAAYPVGARIVVFGLVMALGLSGAFIGFGVALRRLHHQGWLAWTMMIGGPVAALLLSAFGGSIFAYFLLAIMAVALLISPPRDHAA